MRQILTTTYSTNHKAINTFLCWGILANLPFIILSIEYLHPRANFILFYGLLFLISSINFSSSGPRLMARGFVYIAFVAGLVADVLVFGRNFYGIKLKEAIYSIPNVLDLNIFAFGPYVAMSILLLVCVF